MRAILNIDMAGLTLAQVREAMTSCSIAYGRHSHHIVQVPFELSEKGGPEIWDTLAIHVDSPGAREVDQLARMLG